MTRLRTLLLRADAAARLGPRPVALFALHRARMALGLPRRALDRAAAGSLPDGAVFLPDSRSPVAAADPVPLLARLRALPPVTAPAPASVAVPAGTAGALTLDLFAGGDARLGWEANRWSELPLLMLARRADPAGPWSTLAETRIREWIARNPPFRGPNWACGQEAALRTLHLCVALELDGGLVPTAAAAALLRLHAARVRATGAYACAQDNNHAVSEPAGLYAATLLLGGDPAPHASALSRAVGRLVGPAGGFAPVSTGYQRLLLDTLSVVEWLRRRRGAPPLPAPFAERAAAATEWLARLVDPATGAAPRLGHQDGSRLADLSGGGEEDSRGSVERASRLFRGASAGFADDPGCAWLGLPAAPAAPAEDTAGWRAEGSRGWRAAGARALLRTGPLRFRPHQSDLLHLDLWDGPLALVRDGGSFLYNDPSGAAEALAGAAGHDAAVFDDAEPMPRAGRFLFARWPATGLLPDGAWSRDRRGFRHARRVRAEGRTWTVTDDLDGGFGAVSIAWRLAPAAWRRTADGVESPLARIAVSADAPPRWALEAGTESPAYGVLRPVPVLRVRAARPVRRIVSVFVLP